MVIMVYVVNRSFSLTEIRVIMSKRWVINGADQPLRSEDCEIPEAQDGKVRIRIAYSGVCHSELHMKNDVKGITRGILGEENFNKIVLGHEISGYVDEIAADLDPKSLSFTKGDRVVVYPWFGCQKCGACEAGMCNICQDPGMFFHCAGLGPFSPGGYQTHLLVDPKWIYKVPESIPLDVACLLACSGGTSYAAIDKLQESIDFGVAANGKARILIIGAGGLGLWGLKLAKIIHGNNVELIAADLDEGKLTVAKKYGADVGVVWPRGATEEENVQAVVKDGQVQGVIDYVGTSSTLSTAVKCLCRYGMLAIVGLAGGQVNESEDALVLTQKTIRACGIFSPKQFRELLSLVEKEKISYPDITHYPLDKVNDVLDMLAKGQVTGRAILKQE